MSETVLFYSISPYQLTLFVIFIWLENGARSVASTSFNFSCFGLFCPYLAALI